MQNKGIKTLFVEDNKTDCMAFQRFVKKEQLPYDYDVAISVASAKRALEKNSYEIILTDYDLGDGTAFDLIEFIPVNIPFVIITGTGNEEVAVNIMKAGATDYLIKDPAGRYLTMLPVTVDKALKDKASDFKLKSYEEQLESMVKKRTKELARTVENLKQEIETRKRMERSLTNSEAKYSVLVEHAKDAILIIRKNKIEFANKAFVDMIGYTVEEIYEMLSTDLIAPEHRKASVNRYHKRKKDEYVANINEAVLYKKNKTILPVEVNVAGDIIYKDKYALLVILRDLSDRIKMREEREKLEKRLLHLQKMESIGTLAGGIAHDFNNILFPIIGYTEMTMAILSENNSAMKNLNAILSASLRAKDLVQQILSFSSQQDQELIPISPQIIVKEVLKLIRASIPSTIKIKQDIAADSALVIADPTHIHQIIMNLCTNAYQAMEKDGGILDVSLKNVKLSLNDVIGLNIEHGEYLLFQVKDTGCGMDESVKMRIFEPYFTTKGTSSGTGLGLAVVHGIVKSYNGTIECWSEPGKGTCFSIYFPLLVTDDFTEPASTADNTLPSGTGHILLIDDEPVLVDLIKDIIKAAGYSVAIRTSSLEALEAFRAQPEKFDLVVTDLTMPNMTGDKLAVELIKIRSDIPVILCTGFSNKLSKERITALGIKDILLKPVQRKKILQALHKILGTGTK